MTDYSMAVLLAQSLVRIDTRNPAGNEQQAAELIREHLLQAGVSAALQEVSPGRTNLIATLHGSDPGRPAVLLSGHLDTVGVGDAEWEHPPLSGLIENDRLHGRGSSDMKGGAAAMVVAFERLATLFRYERPQASVILALTVAEETGCQGAEALVPLLPAIGAIVVGEATDGRIAIGHKGVMWLTLDSVGVAAHASAPELGVNAIAPLVERIGRIARLERSALAPLSPLGRPSIVTTTIQGGSSRNTVPDHASSTIDVRLTDTFSHEQALAFITDLVSTGSEEISLSVSVDLVLPPVLTSADDPWIAETAALIGADANRLTMNYFTDAAVLSSPLGEPPVCIYGPGTAALAHQTDEFCSITAIDACTDAYISIAHRWATSVYTTET